MEFTCCATQSIAGTYRQISIVNPSHNLRGCKINSDSETKEVDWKKGLTRLPASRVQVLLSARSQITVEHEAGTIGVSRTNCFIRYPSCLYRSQVSPTRLSLCKLTEDSHSLFTRTRQERAELGVHPMPQSNSNEKKSTSTRRPSISQGTSCWSKIYRKAGKDVGQMSFATYCGLSSHHTRCH